MQRTTSQRKEQKIKKKMKETHQGRVVGARTRSSAKGSRLRVERRMHGKGWSVGLEGDGVAGKMAGIQHLASVPKRRPHVLARRGGGQEGPPASDQGERAR